MKFSALYSNLPREFPRVDFRPGLNVIFAQISDPADRTKSMHNLGKSFLIQVIDFVLLKEIKGRHAFRRREVFSPFVFYLEIETVHGRYVTVRRAVGGKPKTAINVSDERGADLTSLDVSEWTHPKLALRKAKATLDELLDLSSMSPFGYRPGAGYFLRQQDDWQNIFRISNFERSRDAEWKPLMARMLGFPSEPVERKYEIEESVDALKLTKSHFEKQAGTDSQRYDELAGLIEVREGALAGMRRDIDAFSFGEIEAAISHTTVAEVEVGISVFNEEQYSIEYEIGEIQRSQRTEFEFDVDMVRRIFEEMGASLPEQLLASYDELLEFNRSISSSRSERLAALKTRLESRLKRVRTALAELNQERSAAMRQLAQRKTMKKYRNLQERERDERAKVQVLRDRLALLDKVTLIDAQIDDLRTSLAAQVARVAAMLRQGTPTFRAIRGSFNAMAEALLNTRVVLSVTRNSRENLEFSVRTLSHRDEGRETDESEGTSYKKLLCVCFDLALLRAHASGGFYRFVYHDGVFEALDNRKKVALLELVRSVCAEDSIQYILTVTDTDLPRSDGDKKMLFAPEEIVRRLTDQGAQGRLFRMTRF